MSTWAVKTKKKLSLASLTAVSRIVGWLAAAMPYGPGIRLGAALGFASFYLLRRERSRTLTHLALVFPDKSPDWIRAAARRCFVHLGKSVLEVMLMTPGLLARAVTVHGEENLRNALSRGKGVVYVTGHIGNWEVMGHMLASLSTLSVVAAPIDPPKVNDIIVGLRAAMGVRTILRGRQGASRELIRVFRENRILGILIDQDTDVESAFVDFFGMPAWTPTAAASMAIKFGAPILFGYIHRGSDNRHTMVIEGPLDPVRTGDDEKDTVATTAMLTRKIEDAVLKKPEQWVWMHRRWRRKP